MTEKAEFNAEEWSAIVEGPATAAMMVVVAEKGGTLRETIEIAKVYAEAARQHQGPDLMHEIVSTPPRIEGGRYHSAEELRAAGLERVREAARLVEQKAEPAEAEEYRRFVLTLCETAAKSHKEGGFLGIGGTEVSEAEQSAIEEVRTAIGAGDG